MKKYINVQVIVSALLAIVAYDLVVKGLINKTDTYEYDEFQGSEDEIIYVD